MEGAQSTASIRPQPSTVSVENAFGGAFTEVLNWPVSALVESEHERHASDQWARLTIPPSAKSPASSIATEATTSPLSPSPFPITAAPTPEAIFSFQGLQPRPKLANGKTVAIHSTSPISPSTGSSIRVSTVSDSLGPSLVAITPNSAIDKFQNPVSAVTNDGTIAANKIPISTVTLHTSTEQTNSSPSPTFQSLASTRTSTPSQNQAVNPKGTTAVRKESTILAESVLTTTVSAEEKAPSPSSTTQNLIDDDTTASVSKTGISHDNSSLSTLATIIFVKVNGTTTLNGHTMTMSGSVHEPIITTTTTVKYESAKPADSTGCRLHLGLGRIYWIAVGVVMIFVWAMELLT